MKKYWVGVIVAVAALAAVGVGVNLYRQRGLPEGFAGANGRLELARRDVASLHPGRIEAVQVAEGDSVAPNQVLAVLSSEQSSSQLSAAQAQQKRAQEAVARAEAEVAAQRQQLKVAQMELANTQMLKNDALVSQAELDKRRAARDGAQAAVKAAEAARAEAQAAVSQAQAQVGAATSANRDMNIRAPAAGRVEYVLAQAGNVLGSGSRVVTLLDPADVSMAVFFPTTTTGKIRIGDEARIVLDGMDAVWPAKVVYVADEAQFTPKYVETDKERAKLMYRVKLQIPADIARRYSGLLKGGLVGNGYVRTDAAKTWPSRWQVKLPPAAAAEVAPAASGVAIPASASSSGSKASELASAASGA